MSMHSAHQHYSRHGGEYYPGEKARQGTIILRERWQRGAFIAGLVGVLLLTLIAVG